MRPDFTCFNRNSRKKVRPFTNSLIETGKKTPIGQSRNQKKNYGRFYFVLFFFFTGRRRRAACWRNGPRAAAPPTGRWRGTGCRCRGSAAWSTAGRRRGGPGSSAGRPAPAPAGCPTGTRRPLRSRATTRHAHSPDPRPCADRIFKENIYIFKCLSWASRYPSLLDHQVRFLACD